MINPFFYYKKNDDKFYEKVCINRNFIDAGPYAIKKIFSSGDKVLEISFVIILQQEFHANFFIKLEFELAESEYPLSFPTIFPEFNFKSLSPVFIPFLSQKQQFILSSSKSYAFKINNENKKKLSVDFFIDAPFLHPSWNYETPMRSSSSMPLLPKGTQYNFDLQILKSETCRHFPVQQFPYPFARKAAFVLTDHSDFDTAEKLHVFLYGNNNNGWLNRNLKISKGVFTIGAKENEPHKNDSLDQPAYKNLIDVLYKDGSEILPHALKSKGQLTSQEFHNALNKLALLYHPKTWIDHGSYLKYCFSQGAKENPEYLLVKNLKHLNYNNLWSFHDVNIESNNTLNIFETKQVFPLRVLALSLKYFFTGKWLIAAHYLRSIIHRNYSKNIVKEYLMYVMAQSKGIFINKKNKKHQTAKDLKYFFLSLFKFKSFHNQAAVPYESADVLKYCSALYLEERKPFAQYSPNELLMFCTFETTHLIDIYTKKSLLKLIYEYGSHIGHTYILNDLPYINSIFEKENNQYFLKDKWIDFLDVLTKNIAVKNIWNPTMSEYAAYMISLQNISIKFLHFYKIEIINNNEYDVNGYTFITPLNFKKIKMNDKIIIPSESDTKYNFFTIFLSAKEKIILTSPV